MNNSKPGQKQTDRDSYIIHAVQSKETLYSIARKYNVSPEALANWNQLQGYEVKIGQSLKIYK
jgi:LysM repeat protein